MTTPTAQVLEIRGKYITVRCPGCGLTRTGAERLTGYVFTIPTN